LRAGALDLKTVLHQAPGVNRRFIYYLEAQGYIAPEKLRKQRIARRDYSQRDLHIIRETWRYYDRGFSLQAAYHMAITAERVITYLGFPVPPRRRPEVVERLKSISEVVEVSAVYADTIDMIVKTAAPEEADLYHAVVPVLAQAGVAGVSAMWRAAARFERDGRSRKKERTGMMAYLLMKVPGKDVNQVMDALRDMPEVMEASTVYGESDIIARIETASQADLDSFVMDRVHGIPAVESTRTYIVVGNMHWKRG
jgi:DNA-binding Lrp family transcriptional regulator